MEKATSRVPRLAFGDDGSPGADQAWQWISAQRWPGWQADVVSVTAPDPTIESLFAHEPLHEYEPDIPRLAPDSMELAWLLIVLAGIVMTSIVAVTKALTRRFFVGRDPITATA